MASAETEETFGASAEVDPEEEAFENPDVENLIRRWRNEKYAPEVLPFDQALIENMSEVLDFVTETLEEERVEGQQDPHDPDFCLRSLDLERMRYILRDYLRIRLWKLTQWPQHYLQPTNQTLLSTAERTFLKDFWDNKKLFFENRLLLALPAASQNLEDTNDLLDMVRRPDIEKHVYVRIRSDLGKIDIPPSMTQESAGTQQPLVLSEGSTYLLRYCLVKEFLTEPQHDGKVELI
eukprot:CAMPEP_0197649954 /NCGR_PEP_ID=MMETSP1338-20131121/30392_1 /TAXON_ID=43686 ORGANISM="Pelagodinium beii, Strain RCC1491" /NCGR_SAMPLE_ID=MMETSP1338 /ASSEMBLY_ACC=CAM_ASM_000754 /LENGTH=235 /DNA_ID=CAMNT_0043224269 /DNA_START=52 /DNA_END=759 /DNA_ORIENTATION=+